MIKMVELNISYNVVDKKIYVNSDLATPQQIKEFEDEVLGKKLFESTPEEILNAIDELKAELSAWLKYKDFWKTWKTWAETQINK
jgi:ACT domain-containing protein